MPVELTHALLAIAVIGVVVAGVTELFKKLLMGIFGTHLKDGRKDPKWWGPMWKLIAVLMGGVMGLFFDFPDPWNWGIGLVAGVMATLVYKKAKTWLTDFKVPGKK